jgi:hypothetical protein
MSEEHSNEEYAVGQYGCAIGRDYLRVSTKHAEWWAIGKLGSGARFRWSGQAARPRCPTRGPRGKQAVRSKRQAGSITAERRARTARTDDGAKGRRQARPTGAELAESGQAGPARSKQPGPEQAGPAREQSGAEQAGTAR